MNLADLQQYLPVVTALGGLGSAFPVANILLHRREKKRLGVEAKQKAREQKDEVALDLVEQLTKRVGEVETRAEERVRAVEDAAAMERKLCDAKLAASDAKVDSLQHQLRLVEGMIDSLLLAIEVAPDKAAEVVAKVKDRREAKKAA
jgi:hypothetical protein